MIQNKKKVIIISAVFPPEPVVSAKLSLDIAIALSEKYEVIVLSPKPTRPLGFIFENLSHSQYNFKHVILNSYTCAKSNLWGRFIESISFGIQCRKYIQSNFFDVSFIYMNTWPIFAQYISVQSAKKYKIPYYIHIQDIYPEALFSKLNLGKQILYKLLLPIDKFNLKNAKKLIIISSKMANYISHSRKINHDKIIFIPNWQSDIEFELFKEIPSEMNNIPANRPFIFMYLGNIGPLAGIDLLIDAFTRAKMNNAQLVIAGSGSEKSKLESKAKKYSHCSIEFWVVPEGKVPQVQEMADVLILPLKKGAGVSSVPSKLIAYMFSGKPIIASVDFISETAEVILKSECGWVVTPENLEALVQQMEVAYLTSMADLHKFGKNGRIYSIQNFSKKPNLDKLISILT